jgi:hypothetical protein
LTISGRHKHRNQDASEDELREDDTYTSSAEHGDVAPY